MLLVTLRPPQFAEHKTLQTPQYRPLRRRPVLGALAEGNASQQDWIKFKTSDGKLYQAHSGDWERVLKADPGVKRIK
jgi:hypothetical protein